MKPPSFHDTPLAGVFAVTLAALLALLALRAAEPSPAVASGKSHKLTSVSMRKLTDSLRSIAGADRDAYLAQVVEPAGAAADLPSHATLFRQAALAIQKVGAEFSYTLRSSAPMHERNGPQTPFEQEGLERVGRHPDQAVYGEEELGGRSYFTAIYADRATRTSCAECHNRHPHSPRRDYQSGDVLGALIIRIPLEF